MFIILAVLYINKCIGMKELWHFLACFVII